MADRRLSGFLVILLLLAAISPVSAVKQPQGDPDEDDVQEEAAPEPPRQIINIQVKDDRLNVELENADFGAVIRAVAEKAKFRLEGSSAAFGKKLTTKFSDVEIDRGISRLFSLVKENNFFIHYTAEGAVDKLRIFPAGAGTSAAPGPRPPSGMPATAPPPPGPAAVTPPRPQAAPVRPSAPPQRTVRPQVFPDDDDDDDDEEEAVPYVAPQPRQPMFPPKR